MNSVSAAVSDAVGKELGEQGPSCLRVKCVDVVRVQSDKAFHAPRLTHALQLPRCLNDAKRCKGVGDGPAAGRACRHVLAACGAKGASAACLRKCRNSPDVGGSEDALQDCTATCVYAACRRDEAVLACRHDAAVAAQTACALDKCRQDFAVCAAKRCGITAAHTTTA